MSRYQNLQRLKQLKGAGNKAFGTPRDILELNSTLCFQVVAVVFPQTIIDEKRFEEIKSKYDFSEKEIDEVALFSVDYGPLEVPAGFIAFDDFGNKEVYEPRFETIYTTYYKQVLMSVLSAESEDESDHLKAVAEKYIEILENHFQGLNFAKGIYGKGEDFSVWFQLVVQPYSVALCPPEDLNILKPITIIDGYVIHPTQNRIDLSTVKTPSRRP